MILHKRKKNANEELSVSTEHPELFHYTSLQALAGILETNTLWATHADHLNDSSEMKLLWPKLESQFISYLKAAFEAGPGRDPEIREIAERHGGAAKISEMDGAMIVNMMRSLLFGSESRPGIGIPFVTSFTTHEEERHCQNGMLSQWRGYGGDQGVAIVFDSARLENLVHTEKGRFEYMCCLIKPAVYYDEREFNLEVDFPKLSNAMTNYSKDVVYGSNDGKKERKNREALALNLLPAIGRLKHLAFDEEKECRIIVGVLHESYGYEVAQLEGQRHVKTFHHRSGSCGSIPYIRLFEGLGEELPILRILVGPSRNQSANSEVVRELLDRFARGRAIRVQESEIPYVGTA